MVGDDELRAFRDMVSCATALEDQGWFIDAERSTRHSPRYRNGGADVIVVCQGGRGWFAPTDGPNVKGDVIELVKRLHHVNLGSARHILRRLSGLPETSSFPVRRKRPEAPPQIAREEIELRWQAGHRLVPGDPGWDYLTGPRGLPDSALRSLAGADRLRVGIHGTVWARHTDAAGQVTGWEMRGPQFKGFSKGGTKMLFELDGSAGTTRLAVAEAFIDAISLACVEGWRSDTLYVSTGGGWGTRVHARLRELAADRRLVAATDAGMDGDRLAEALIELAGPPGIERVRPDGEGVKDWNDVLRVMIDPRNT